MQPVLAELVAPLRPGLEVETAAEGGDIRARPAQLRARFVLLKPSFVGSKWLSDVYDGKHVASASGVRPPGVQLKPGSIIFAKVGCIVRKKFKPHRLIFELDEIEGAGNADFEVKQLSMTSYRSSENNFLSDLPLLMNSADLEGIEVPKVPEGPKGAPGAQGASTHAHGVPTSASPPRTPQKRTPSSSYFGLSPPKPFPKKGDPQAPKAPKAATTQPQAATTMAPLPAQPTVPPSGTPSTPSGIPSTPSGTPQGPLSVPPTQLPSRSQSSQSSSPVILSSAPAPPQTQEAQGSQNESQNQNDDGLFVHEPSPQPSPRPTTPPEARVTKIQYSIEKSVQSIKQFLGFTKKPTVSFQQVTQLEEESEDEEEVVVPVGAPAQPAVDVPMSDDLPSPVGSPVGRPPEAVEDVSMEMEEVEEPEPTPPPPVQAKVPVEAVKAPVAAAQPAAKAVPAAPAPAAAPAPIPKEPKVTHRFPAMAPETKAPKTVFETPKAAKDAPKAAPKEAPKAPAKAAPALEEAPSSDVEYFDLTEMTSEPERPASLGAQGGPTGPPGAPQTGEIMETESEPSLERDAPRHEVPDKRSSPPTAAAAPAAKRAALVHSDDFLPEDEIEAQRRIEQEEDDLEMNRLHSQTLHARATLSSSFEEAEEPEEQEKEEEQAPNLPPHDEPTVSAGSARASSPKRGSRSPEYPGSPQRRSSRRHEGKPFRPFSDWKEELRRAREIEKGKKPTGSSPPRRSSRRFSSHEPESGPEPALSSRVPQSVQHAARNRAQESSQEGDTTKADTSLSSGTRSTESDQSASANAGANANANAKGRRATRSTPRGPAPNDQQRNRMLVDSNSGGTEIVSSSPETASRMPPMVQPPSTPLQGSPERQWLGAPGTMRGPRARSPSKGPVPRAQSTQEIYSDVDMDEEEEEEEEELIELTAAEAAALQKVGAPTTPKALNLAPPPPPAAQYTPPPTAYRASVTTGIAKFGLRPVPDAKWERAPRPSVEEMERQTIDELLRLIA